MWVGAVGPGPITDRLVTTHRVGGGSPLEVARDPPSWCAPAHAVDVSRETRQWRRFRWSYEGLDFSRQTDPTVAGAYDPGACGAWCIGTGLLIVDARREHQQRSSGCAEAHLQTRLGGAISATIRTLMCAVVSCKEAAGYGAVVGSRVEFTDGVAGARERASRGVILRRSISHRMGPSRHRTPVRRLRTGVTAHGEPPPTRTHVSRETLHLSAEIRGIHLPDATCRSRASEEGPLCSVQK